MLSFGYGMRGYMDGNIIDDNMNFGLFLSIIKAFCSETHLSDQLCLLAPRSRRGDNVKTLSLREERPKWRKEYRRHHFLVRIKYKSHGGNLLEGPNHRIQGINNYIGKGNLNKDWRCL